MVRLSQLTVRQLRERAADPEVLGLDGEMSDRVFDALGSETTRRILALLYENPRTPTELAHETETTLQNVTYHINKLRDADLIEPVTTHYSEKGQSVISYGPTREAVIVVAGPNSIRRRLKTILSRMMVLFVLLGIGAAIVGEIARRLTPAGPPAIRTDTDSVMLESSEPLIYSVSQDPTVIAPLVFFAGGTFILLLTCVFWYYKMLE